MLTGQPAALHHLGARLNQRLEPLDDLGVVLQPNLAPQAGVEPELAPVEHRHVTLDQPGLLPVPSPCASTARPRGRRGLQALAADTGVLLQFGEDLALDSIEPWRPSVEGTAIVFPQKALPGSKTARSRQRRHAAPLRPIMRPASNEGENVQHLSPVENQPVPCATTRTHCSSIAAAKWSFFSSAIRSAPFTSPGTTDPTGRSTPTSSADRKLAGQSNDRPVVADLPQRQTAREEAARALEATASVASNVRHGLRANSTKSTTQLDQRLAPRRSSVEQC